MRTTTALMRRAAPLIVAAMLLAACGAPTADPMPSGAASTPSAAAGQASAPQTAREQGAVPQLPVGSLYKNPASQRNERIVADVEHTAVLIGDSQSEPDNSWPQRAIAALGYKVHLVGGGGTGFVAGTAAIGNYVDALQEGDWALPYGDPPLVVIQGGGNDASRGIPDAQIQANAVKLIAALRKRYPEARLVLVGTLARGAANGGGRRTQVDALLGRVAAKEGVAFVSVGDWLTRYDAAGDLLDGVHLKASGHAKLGPILARRLAAFGLGIGLPPGGVKPLPVQ
ncbi:SGNH/GDSL hydrolase family protein [Arthrobacter sp. CJ23]|uniref:SGNH/GDSL hydrolase family protein n=1 Tax=Arthrobacter sp. CJ23 TaxID=2972479 RepID=UPI00215D2168|nr:SGNH/GDSL hydrolase family protein [Arthrobacter sp. CJ23]UVJ38435.1 SGNH/GDSL hydrolase family protein [Arthrobacter sp. CJ23]